MSDHSLELQKSIFNALDGDSTLQNLVTDVYDLLHEASLSVTGASLVFIRFEFSDIIKENDGLTTHGFQRFRALVNDS